MGRIHQLDGQTVNMIAAGEVVERPQGVVKELVENAIDAGSTRIAVASWQGGIEKLTVSDNGCGMSSEDAEMAFHRHATSKINGQNDLWNISTLGFRGEALPSIASVSKLTMNTSDGNDSTRIRIEYGKMVEKESFPCDQGTQITVEGLFYRTPARLKHLRSSSYENALIQDVIMSFAMSHPEIAFSYISNGKEAFRTSGSGDLLEVLYFCWGREPAENALKLHLKDFDYEIDGYIVKPFVNRSSRNFMHIFLNGRMVRTSRLYKAVEDGYAGFLPAGRKPMCAMNVKMDPHLLDVNVHPSKWEVRISKENQLEYLIRDGIHEALSDHPSAPVVHQPDEVREEEPVYYAPVHLDLDAAMPKQSQQTPPVEQQPDVPAEEKMEEAAEVIEESDPLPEMRVIGQLHDRLVLCEIEKGIAVLDPRACQQRILYEQILNTPADHVVMNQLLVPLTLQTDASVVSMLDELNAFASDLHISFEAFGPDTLLVREVPSWMKDCDEKQILNDLIEDFRAEDHNTALQKERRRIAAKASSESIHQYQKLSMAEMEQLVRDLSQCRNPAAAPDGKPTFIVVEERDLLKEFGR